MFKRIGRLLASAALLTACALGTVQAAEEKAINFGIMSTESSQNLKSIWQPFLDDMSRKTGLKVNANLHAPLLCVENVFKVASGDLGLPGKVSAGH